MRGSKWHEIIEEGEGEIGLSEMGSDEVASYYRNFKF